MINTILAQQKPQIQLNWYTTTQLPPGIDFSAPPWPGLARCLFWTYRLDLPHLRALVLQRIEELSWEGGR